MHFGTGASRDGVATVVLTALGALFGAAILAGFVYVLYRAVRDIVRGQSRFTIWSFLIPAGAASSIAAAIGLTFEAALLAGLGVGALVIVAYVTIFWKGL